MAWWRGRGYWSDYVPVAQRAARAKKEVEKLRKKGLEIQPVEPPGRNIASSFWGKGWCDHMDSFHDYENRLPRGRAYVRNGSVVHMDIAKGKVFALVAGTSTYEVEIIIELLPKDKWEHIKSKCAGQIASLMDLLRGKLSDGVMKVVANRSKGLFPGPREIKMSCSCPDYASLCKHIAAVIYGIGARLDSRPELLFLLRGVDHGELAAEGGVEAVVQKGKGAKRELAGVELSEIFGIELVETGEEDRPPPAVPDPPVKKAPRKAPAGSKAEPKKTPRKAAVKPAAKAEPPARAVKNKIKKKPAGKTGKP
ncbi:MAG: SWIM zinc finger family protein [Deltaproteobacteria bacterium]|nr:SWIM zinc finger family protein [Deltaproteobacteria bacterium]